MVRCEVSRPVRQGHHIKNAAVLGAAHMLDGHEGYGTQRGGALLETADGVQFTIGARRVAGAENFYRARPIQRARMGQPNVPKTARANESSEFVALNE